MLVIPAIDLKGGRCVRLVQGDMDRETVFADDPVPVARGFREAGAEWIHMVDLDGAVQGTPVNHEAIAAVCRSVDARVEVGGGVRDRATLEGVFAAGVGRVVLGTVALRDPDFFAEACRAHPGAILAGGVRVGSGALIGMGVTLNLGVEVGAGARVGNGSTVKSDVPSGGIVRAGSIWPE